MGNVMFMRKGEVHTAPVGGLPISSLAVGTIVKLNVNGIPTDFIVVNQGIPSGSSLYDESCNGTWLLMKDCYDKRIWGPENEAITDMGHYAYGEGTGNIHDWCNQTFFNYLDSNVKSIIKQVKIPYVSGNGVSHNETKSGSSGLLCKVFILSAREVCSPFNETNTPHDGARLEYFKDTSSGNPSATEAYLNGVSIDWWTRSPAITEYGNILFVAGCAYGSGLRGINNPLGGDPKAIASRPAFILPSSALTTVNYDGVTVFKV